MTLKTSHKTLVLIIASQIPMALLLVIFFNIPDLPSKYRIMAMVTILLEAALMSEMIGNIVQKVRANDKQLYIREILERRRIPWEQVKGMEQVLVSPMRRGSTEMPTKLFLVKTKDAVHLEFAEQWWIEHGPLRNRRDGMLDLVEKYDDYIRKELKGWHLLWKQDHRRPQDAADLVDVEYAAIDHREQVTVDDLITHGGKRAEGLMKAKDWTYPAFFKKHGEKYKKDLEHLWGTITA